jgi:hypothetical protein
MGFYFNKLELFYPEMYSMVLYHSKVHHAKVSGKGKVVPVLN